MAFSKELEDLMEAVIADGQITEKERIALHKRAEKEGVSPEEVEVFVDSRLDEIRKRQARSTNCPICQAEIPYGVSICPKCGWQRSKSVDIAASNFIQDFSKGLVLAEKQDRKGSYIKNYPLPNSKADLIEFALFLKVQSFKTIDYDNDAPELESMTWLDSYDKYKECISKLQMLYPNDPQAVQVIDNYKRLMKYQKDWKYNSSLPSPGCMSAFVAIIVGCIMGVGAYKIFDSIGYGFATLFLSAFLIWAIGYILEKTRIKNKTIPLENIDELL